MSDQHECKRIMLLPGDGVGPEVMQQSVKLLRALEEPFGLQFEFEEGLVGGAALRKFGVPITPETLERCKAAHAVLLGPVGDPEFDRRPENLRPEYALVQLRTAVDAYCSLRSIRAHNLLPRHLPTGSTQARDVDIVVVQALHNGYYYREFAQPNAAGWENHPEPGPFRAAELERVARKSLSLAQIRKRRLSAVSDPSAPVRTRHWRSLVEKASAPFPAVRVEFLSVNACVSRLREEPFDFDVIFCDSPFAESVNTAAARISESSGMLASACLGDGVGIYQPVHDPNSALAGKNLVSPIAMLNSAALMLHYSFGMSLAARNVEEAISAVLARGFHTADMPMRHGTTVSTNELCQHVVDEVRHFLGKTFMTV